jgi:hypothetical protein
MEDIPRLQTDSLPVEVRRALAQKAAKQLKRRHSGERYGCRLCYQDYGYAQGEACPERALVVEYERLAAAEDTP